MNNRKIKKDRGGRIAKRVARHLFITSAGNELGMFKSQAHLDAVVETMKTFKFYEQSKD